MPNIPPSQIEQKSCSARASTILLSRLHGIKKSSAEIQTAIDQYKQNKIYMLRDEHNVQQNGFSDKSKNRRFRPKKGPEFRRYHPNLCKSEIPFLLFRQKGILLHTSHQPLTPILRCTFIQDSEAGSGASGKSLPPYASLSVTFHSLTSPHHCHFSLSVRKLRYVVIVGHENFFVKW